MKIDKISDYNSIIISEIQFLPPYFSITYIKNILIIYENNIKLMNIMDNIGLRI